MSKLKTLAAAALLVGGVCASALAQEASYWPADANRDGVVARDEWMNEHAPSSGMATRIDALPSESTTGDLPQLSYRAADTDGDGYVSRSEWDRYHDEVLRSLRDRGVERPEGEFSYSRADANQDGYVSDDEWDRYHGDRAIR